MNALATYRFLRLLGIPGIAANDNQRSRATGSAWYRARGL